MKRSRKIFQDLDKQSMTTDEIEQIRLNFQPEQRSQSQYGPIDTHREYEQFSVPILDTSEDLGATASSTSGLSSPISSASRASPSTSSRVSDLYADEEYMKEVEKSFGFTERKQGRVTNLLSRARDYFRREPDEFESVKPSKWRKWMGISKKPQQPRFPRDIHRKEYPASRQQLLDIVEAVLNQRTRWQNEFNPSMHMHDEPRQREINHAHKLYIKHKYRVGQQIASNIMQINKMAEKLEYCELLLSSMYGRHVDKNKIQLFEELKNAWKEMSAAVAETTFMYQDLINNFIAAENESSELLDDTELEVFQLRMDKLKKYTEKDRKTLNLIEENMNSMLGDTTKPKLDAPRFKVKKMFPMKVRDQRSARKRVKEFQHSIEERVRPGPTIYDDPNAYDTNEYSAYYRYDPSYDKQRRRRQI